MYILVGDDDYTIDFNQHQSFRKFTDGLVLRRKENKTASFSFINIGKLKMLLVKNEKKMLKVVIYYDLDHNQLTVVPYTYLCPYSIRFTKNLYFSSIQKFQDAFIK